MSSAAGSNSNKHTKSKPYPFSPPKLFPFDRDGPCFTHAIAHLAFLYEHTIREKDGQQNEVVKQKQRKKDNENSGGRGVIHNHDVKLVWVSPKEKCRDGSRKGEK